MEENDKGFEELVKNYGNEYLLENYPDDALYSMEELNDFFQAKTNLDILMKSFFGCDYEEVIKNRFLDTKGTVRVPFNPNKDWFTLNGYGNLVSVDDMDYMTYLVNHIDKDDFMTWCAANTPDVYEGSTNNDS